MTPEQEEIIKAVKRIKLFKPNSIRINSDVLNEPIQLPQRYNKAMLQTIRRLVFMIASGSKTIAVKGMKDIQTELTKQLPSESQFLAALIWTCFSAGYTNGLTDFANNLIDSIEETDSKADL